MLEQLKERTSMVGSMAGIETELIHAGEPEQRIGGAVAMPIFQSSTFEYSGESGYHEIRYGRLNNTPNHLALHRKLATLEKAEAALVTASGMAAISTTLLSLLKSGDHLLAQECLYGGTIDFLTQDLPRWEIGVDFIDGDDAESWADKCRPNTRLIYIEPMTNPLLQVADLRGAVEFAREHNLVSIIDNTFATPINFQPMQLGFDLSLHSGTKYLGGHDDISAGAVIGRRYLIEKILPLLNHLGGCLDPHTCFLLDRGLKTLAVRLRYQNESAQKIARFLEQHSAVARVRYPGLESHPRHSRAAGLFAGFGAVLSFELNGGTREAENFIRRLKLVSNAPSLGGVQTLLMRPAATSHAGMSAEYRNRLGIRDELIRLSVGLETTEDLIADLDRGLKPD
jgi:cystathionine beta-lyase/cystathionine gamma-synthase